jgi:hypothetical protein
MNVKLALEQTLIQRRYYTLHLRLDIFRTHVMSQMSHLTEVVATIFSGNRRGKIVRQCVRRHKNRGVSVNEAKGNAI